LRNTLDQTFAHDGVGNLTFNSAISAHAYPDSG
jgi:hypothetical protein